MESKGKRRVGAITLTETSQRFKSLSASRLKRSKASKLTEVDDTQREEDPREADKDWTHGASNAVTGAFDGLEALENCSRACLQHSGMGDFSCDRSPTMDPPCKCSVATLQLHGFR